MDNNQKLNLQKLIKDNDVKDNTDKIRELKHSFLINKDVIQIQKIKTTYADKDIDFIIDKCTKECNFLFSNYTDLFNKIVKDRLDLNILKLFLIELNKIEEGKTDQHNASYNIGLLLRKMYIDSAINNDNESSNINEYKEGKNIGWKQFKLMNNM